MHTRLAQTHTTQQGYALIMTLVVSAICLALLASICNWCSSDSKVTARNNAYRSSVTAAESATEVVIAQLDRDFLHQALNPDVNAYNGILPSSVASGSWPSAYSFTDGQGNSNLTGVVCNDWQTWTNLNSEYTGLFGIVSSYQITSQARCATGQFPVAAAVRQDIQLTAIPIFQFAIFYSMDLEMNPSPPMKVTGPVHGNANIYISPGTSLEFLDPVAAVGTIYNHRSPNDPQSSSGIAPVYDSGHLSGAGSMTLPVGTDNNPSNVVQILDIPSFGESPGSQMGVQRYYNKSDLVITITNNSISVGYNNNENGSSFSLVPTNTIAGGTNCGFTFVNTNASFYDYREAKTVLCTQIDVQALTNWMAGAGFSFNLLEQSQTGHQINSVYVNDQRSVSGKLTAVRLAHGQYLPSSGLTVATPNPLYVLGNFNAPDLTVGSTNTSQTKPSSLVADAITILSTSWSDGYNSSTALGSRTASDTTVNAAMLAGIVPSVTVNGVKHYSGGVENFPRFLENWSSKNLTYNGSMVVLFSSRFATNYWANTSYYNPPNRLWAFDVNFQNSSKLPPGTPQVRKLQRGDWNVIAANNN